MTIGSITAGLTRKAVVFATTLHIFGLRQAVASAQRQEKDAERAKEAAVAVSNRAEALCAAAYASEDQAVIAERKAQANTKNVIKAAVAEAKLYGRKETFA
ncbi:hypothetical protein [Caulobacter phage DCM]|uniref:Uncharacterized protein n=1 Tax=Caulobacter phage DCM TaxID=3020391 RepID=A0AAF0B401_9CAUD|nr:hypothetical protein [Caulobacter phage DCM]WCD56094.1 hypothetical protein [Caulobacter phage BL199]